MTIIFHWIHSFAVNHETRHQTTANHNEGNKQKQKSFHFQVQIVLPSFANKLLCFVIYLKYKTMCNAVDLEHIWKENRLTIWNNCFCAFCELLSEFSLPKSFVLAYLFDWQTFFLLVLLAFFFSFPFKFMMLCCITFFIFYVFPPSSARRLCGWKT